MTYYNFVKETCSGTGDEITLLGAVAGFLSFEDVSFEGDNFAYVIVDADGQRKVTGTAADFFYPDTMFRNDTWAFDGTEVVADPSVNIALSAGVHTIYCAESAEQLETILSRIGLAESAVLKRRKNAVINGNFDIWQRDTSQTNNGYGSADRWRNVHVGASKVVTRQAFDIGVSQPYWDPTFYMRTVVTSSVGASNFCGAQHFIEGVKTYAGKQVTLSFWAKSDASRQISFEAFQSFGTGGSPSTIVTEIGVTKFNINSFGWTKCETTFTIPSVFGKTLGTNNNDFLGLFFWFDAGSSFNSRTDSLGHQSGTFEISQVQLELGDKASDFEFKTPAQELIDCQRYFQRVFNVGLTGAARSTTQIYAAASLPIIMRVEPSISVVGSFAFSSNGNFSATPTITVYNVFGNAVRVVLEGFAGLTSGYGACGNGGGSLHLDAEL